MAQPDDGQPTTDQATDRRATVAEAALLLGLSEDAVRSRLKRGTLRRETGPDGTVLVVLGPDGSTGRPTTSRNQSTTSQPTDQPAQGIMQAHLDSLQDQIVHLRRQLEEAHEANRENRRIIAGLVQRVPELEATPEPRESDVSASEEQGSTDAPSENQGQEKPVSRWRRLFGRWTQSSGAR
jgi:hypothetical protein